nr:hypothetical protein Itr_chr04CG05910 [Ipomoea trifida]
MLPGNTQQKLTTCRHRASYKVRCTWLDLQDKLENDGKHIDTEGISGCPSYIERAPIISLSNPFAKLINVLIVKLP